MKKTGGQKSRDSLPFNGRNRHNLSEIIFLDHCAILIAAGMTCCMDTSTTAEKGKQMCSGAGRNWETGGKKFNFSLVPAW